MKRIAMFALVVLAACATGGPPTLFGKGIGLPLREGDALIDCAPLTRIATDDAASRPGAEEACVQPGPDGVQESLTWYTDRLGDSGFQQRIENPQATTLRFCRGEELVVLSPMMRPLQQGAGDLTKLSGNLMRAPIGFVYVPKGPCDSI